MKTGYTLKIVLCVTEWNHTFNPNNKWLFLKFPSIYKIHQVFLVKVSFELKNINVLVVQAACLWIR